MTLPSVTATLFATLQAAGVDATSTAAAGVADAIGAVPGQVADDRTAPVHGFWFTASLDPSAPALLVYAVVPGRLVRYEWSTTATLTVSVPLSRVSCVTERTAGPERVLTIELDAQSSVTAHEVLTRPHAAEAGVEVGQGISRTDRATYTLAAARTDETGATAEAMLAAFARVLRHTARP